MNSWGLRFFEQEADLVWKVAIPGKHLRHRQIACIAKQFFGQAGDRFAPSVPELTEQRYQEKRGINQSGMIFHRRGAVLSFSWIGLCLVWFALGGFTR